MPSKKNRSIAAARLPEPSDAARAFAAVEQRLRELPEARVRRVNVSLPTAVSVALAAAERLREHREAMARLPDFPIEQAEALATYALAALHAWTRARPAPEPARRDALLDEAKPLRARLLTAAETLVTFGLLDEDRVAAVRSGQGHLDTARDLVALGALFEANWHALHDKTPLEEAEVSRASRLGVELLTALGADATGQASLSRDDAAALVHRAWTLLAEAYDACRRAMTYLRWHEGDLEHIVPNLHAQRRAGTGHHRPPAQTTVIPAVTDPEVPTFGA